MQSDPRVKRVEEKVPYITECLGTRDDWEAWMIVEQESVFPPPDNAVRIKLSFPHPENMGVALRQTFQEITKAPPAGTSKLFRKGVYVSPSKLVALFSFLKLWTCSLTLQVILQTQKMVNIANSVYQNQNSGRKGVGEKPFGFTSQSSLTPSSFWLFPIEGNSLTENYENFGERDY